MPFGSLEGRRAVEARTRRPSSGGRGQKGWDLAGTLGQGRRGVLEAVQQPQGIVHPLVQGQRPAPPCQGAQREGGAATLAVHEGQELLPLVRAAEHNLGVVMVEIHLGETRGGGLSAELGKGKLAPSSTLKGETLTPYRG